MSDSSSSSSSSAQNLLQLAASLGQLHTQFAALAGTLATVVQQLAVVTQQQSNIQQAQQQAAASASSAVSASSNGIAAPVATSSAVPDVASPPSSGSSSSDDSDDDATPARDVPFHEEPAADAAVSLDDVQVAEGGATHQSNGDRAAGDYPSSSDEDEGASSDEDARQHANRLHAQEDDAEVSQSQSTHSRSRGRRGSGSYGRALASTAALRPQRASAAHRSHTMPAPMSTAAAAAVTPASTIAAQSSTATSAASSQPAASVSSADSKSSSSALLLQQLQSLKDSRAQRMPASATAAPAAVVSPVAAPSVAAQVVSPIFAPASSASPQPPSYGLATSPLGGGAHSRRLSTGSNSSSTSSIQPSATALPLDAPEPVAPLRQYPHSVVPSPALQSRHTVGAPLSASACSSPNNLSALQQANMRAAQMHAATQQQQQQVSSPTHRVLSPSRMMRGASAGSGYMFYNTPVANAAASPSSPPSFPRSQSSSLGGGGGTTGSAVPTHAHSLSVDSSAAGTSTAHHPGAPHIFLSSSNKLRLNIGGQLFATTLSTLLREPGGSMFSGMFSGHFPQGDKAIFIDRDPTMFRHVLNYLRDGNICLQGMSALQKAALLKDASYYGLSGLVSLLQLDARSHRQAQRRELSSEKEYKLVEDVNQKDMAQVIKAWTNEEGYEFESWLLSSSSTSKPSKSGEAKKAGAVTTVNTVHLLFSKKLSRGELMLLDRLQNHM